MITLQESFIGYFDSVIFHDYKYEPNNRERIKRRYQQIKRANFIKGLTKYGFTAIYKAVK